jgi:hypothetical protein
VPGVRVDDTDSRFHARLSPRPRKRTTNRDRSTVCGGASRHGSAGRLRTNVSSRAVRALRFNIRSGTVSVDEGMSSTATASSTPHLRVGRDPPAAGRGHCSGETRRRQDSLYRWAPRPLNAVVQAVRSRGDSSATDFPVARDGANGGRGSCLLSADSVNEQAASLFTDEAQVPHRFLDPWIIRVGEVVEHDEGPLSERWTPRFHLTYDVFSVV